MADKLKLFMDLTWRPVEWIISAAGVVEKRARRECSIEIGKSLPKWLLAQSDDTIARLVDAAENPLPYSVNLVSGPPEYRCAESSLFVRCVYQATPHGDCESLDVNLLHVTDLELLIATIRPCSHTPIFLRCLDTVLRGKESVNVFEGDVIEASATPGDRLETFLALSYEGRPNEGGYYQELIWSESHGFMTGGNKINYNTTHTYNKHCFTMHTSWRVIGNIHQDRGFLMPVPTPEKTADK